MDPRRHIMLLATVLGLFACRGEQVARVDSSRVEPRRAATSATAATTVDTLLAAVRQTCDEVAASWGASARAAVHVTADSLMDLSGTSVDTTSVRGCYVDAYDSTAFAKTDTSAHADGPTDGHAYWPRAEQQGWARLGHADADGPDGSSSAFQRRSVRCYVSETWDGGDDADSTHVGGDWYRQQTSCWWHGRELTARDTTPG